jgi:hypothetical protein
MVAYASKSAIVMWTTTAVTRMGSAAVPGGARSIALGPNVSMIVLVRQPALLRIREVDNAHNRRRAPAVWRYRHLLSMMLRDVVYSRRGRGEEEESDAKQPVCVCTVSCDPIQIEQIHHNQKKRAGYSTFSQRQSRIASI